MGIHSVCGFLFVEWFLRGQARQLRSALDQLLDKVEIWLGKGWGRVGLVEQLVGLPYKKERVVLYMMFICVLKKLMPNKMMMI